MNFQTNRLPTGPANVYFTEKLTGLVTTAASTAIVGVGTYFTEEVSVGDTLNIAGEPAGLVVSAVTDDTHITLASVATTSGAGKLATADVNVGFTKGGTQIDTQVTTFTVTTDQTGDTPVDEVVSGKVPSLIIGFAEWSQKNFKRAMPESGNIIRTGTKRRFEVTTSVGYSLLANAVQIRIKPLLDGKNETTDWNYIVTLPLCAPSAQTLSLKFEPKTQRPIMAKFAVFPDVANNDRLWYLGDPTA
jgi:hypothetical protein